MEENFDTSYLHELANKIKSGTITVQEKEYFDHWYNHYRDELLELPVSYAPDTEAVRERIHSEIKKRISNNRNHKLSIFTNPLWRILTAAILFLICCLVFLLIYRNQKTPVELKKIAAEIDVVAGSNKAVLILADGSKVPLQNQSVGLIPQQQGVSIHNNQGELVYKNVIPDASPKINTISIPWGGQYRIQLSDGTKVWLNAASTLKYSTSYTGMKERRVELSGEAYFEVAHDKRKPFIVKTNQQEIKVLGTHFNVNAYADEHRTVTTLEEGLIQVKAESKTKVVKPGQAAVSVNSELNVQAANIKTSLAWKNNKMSFENAGVEEVMRQLSRWYNVKIAYEGKIPDDTITGTISRSSNLSAVLKMLEVMQIRCELVDTPQGKKLIIKP